MPEEKKRVRELFERVERLRDELRVQSHLARKDAEDEWHELEKKWQEVESERSRVQDVMEETAKGALAGVRMTLEELRDGYRKLRDRSTTG